MTDALILIALTVYVIQLGLHEIGERRARSRETALLAMIRSLQNQLSAKDLTGYMELQRADREVPKEPIDPETASQIDRLREIEAARFYDGTNYQQ